MRFLFGVCVGAVAGIAGTLFSLYNAFSYFAQDSLDQIVGGMSEKIVQELGLSSSLQKGSENNLKSLTTLTKSDIESYIMSYLREYAKDIEQKLVTNVTSKIPLDSLKQIIKQTQSSQ